MSSEDTLRSQIQAHSQELWNIVNKTISIPSESVSQESKFYKALTYNFDTLEEQKFAKIHEMIALDKPNLCGLIASLLENKPPSLVMHKSSLPPPSLFTEMEIEELPTLNFS